jgi:hypothetical protein
LEDCIEKLKDLPAQQLVVTIDDEEDLFGPAVVVGSSPEVRHRPTLHCIPNDLVFIGWNLGLRFKVTFDEFPGIVFRGVVDDDNVVVGVVLHGNGLDIVEVSVASSVVVGGDDYAEGQFLIFSDLISLFIVGLFFKGQSVYSLRVAA